MSAYSESIVVRHGPTLAQRILIAAAVGALIGAVSVLVTQHLQNQAVRYNRAKAGATS